MQEPYIINCVAEVRVKLVMLTILDKEAIYKRCFEAILKMRYLLTKSHCNENTDAD